MKTVSRSIFILLFCLCLSGCTTLKGLFSRRDAIPPQSFTAAAQPTLEEITSAITRNSRSIQNFTTENASIHMPGILMPLPSRVTFERPKRLRIQGALSSLGSQEFDFGSNDALFWLWMRRSQGEMWYCRHDLYPVCPVRSMIPINPDWLIEAMGIVEFKPTDQHYGPSRTEEGNWEIVSHCQTPSGQYIKRTVVDSKIGWILRQELYTPQNELIALAATEDTRFDRVSNTYYAKRITVWCKGMDGGQMTLDLGLPIFNSSVSLSPSIFVMPEYEGYRAVDLCSPEFLQQRGAVMPAVSQTIPEANIQTVIR